MSKKRSKNIGSSMKIVFVLLTLLFFFAFTQEAIAATTGKIAGTVTDSETGEPLPMVNCIIEGTYMGGACDYEGDYFIINVPPGIYSVTARMMGYESVTKTDIIVSVDHTTPVNFELRPVTIEVPGIEVVARREIIKMDISASEVVSLPEEIDVTPLVVDIEDFINLQAGIEGFEIRGGGVEQTSFMLDGLMLVDNQRNEIIAKPNISSIKEFVMVKGGFNAEYGNVRSGVINIITKEGSVDKYNGTINFRYRPPGLKHSDVSVFNPDNFYLRPYLETEDSVCWLGTSQWDEETQKQYRPFEGWIAISEMLLSDDDPKTRPYTRGVQRYVHVVAYC
jgi:outer membrane receptor protein involved in Fe transport